MNKAGAGMPEQGTQAPSPAPDLIPAETKNQPRTHSGIGTANGGTSVARTFRNVAHVRFLIRVLVLRNIAAWLAHR